MAETSRIRFGPFVLDRRGQRLFRDGSPVELTQRALALLDALISQPGEIVSREDLVARVWPRTVVTDAAVAKRVQEVRNALDDDHRAPRYVETVPKRGFRFVGSLGAELEHSQPFVGRESALQQLTAAWSTASAGARTTVFVTGEAGIGKSALLRRFFAATPKDAMWLAEGHCTRHGEGQPYLPIATALAELLHDPAAAAVLARCAPAWAQLVPGLADHVPTSSNPRRLMLELSAALDALAERRPVVLAIEDLHWCDPSSLALLDYLMRKPTSARLMIVVTLRGGALPAAPDDVQRLLSERIGRLGVVELRLSRLDEREVTRYLEARLGDDLAVSLGASAYRCSAGLPLFVVWLGDWLHGVVEALLDPEALRRAMPDSLARLFELELAALGAPELELVEAASVIGETFTTKLLTAVTRTPAVEVDRVCRALLRGSGVLVSHGGLASQRFGFAHALLRDALYQRIDPPRRATLHGSCGDELSATGADAAMIAHHYTVAGRRFEAAQQRVRAGREAIAAHGLIEARGHFEAALEDLGMVATPEVRTIETDALLGLGHCLVATTGYAAERVGAVYERACALTASTGDPLRRYAALNGAATFQLMRGRLNDAARYDAPMFAAAEASGDATVQARAYAHRGERYYYQGRLQAAFDDMQAAAALLERGAPDPVGWSNWTLITITVQEYQAQLACEQGRLDAALGHVHAMFDVLVRSPHPYSECMAHYFAALTRLARDDMAEAQVHVDRMRRLATEHHYYDLAIWAGIIEGHLDCRAGALDAGIASLRMGLERLDTSGVLLARTAVMLLLAEGLTVKGDQAEARALIDDTERLLELTGERCREPALHLVRARLLAAANDVEGARQNLHRAVDASRTIGSWLWEVRALSKLVRFDAAYRTELVHLLEGLDGRSDAGVVVAARAATAL